MMNLRKSKYLRSIERQDSHIFYHSLYGDAIELDNNLANFLSSFDEDDERRIPSEIDIEMLIKKRFLVSEQTNERRILQEIVQERRRGAPTGRFIRNLQLNVSELCNFACTYCIQNRANKSRIFYTIFLVVILERL